MRRSLFSRLAATALLVLTCALAVSAQVVSATGKVTMKQADGTEVPVAGAIVDFYRTDIAGKLQTKTDKKGNYVHAGIPLVGTFTIAVSAPGAQPSFISGIRVSQQSNNNFVLSPGDDTRLTLEQTRTAAPSNNAGSKGKPAAAAAAAAPSGESKEDKAKAEEMRKKIAEIEASNKKIEEGNSVVKRTFDAGNEAYKAKNYDQAISLYNEGLAARPDEAGLLVSKSFALIGRGVARFNESIKNKDEASRDSAFKDWREAADAANRGVELTKAASADPGAQTVAAQNKVAAMTARAEAMKFVATKVDKTQIDAALTAFQELIAIEPDAAKKSKLGTDMARMLFDAGDYARAADEYRKILAADADNAEANLYLGFSLFNTGDKAKYQEAANYIGQFVAKAPDTNPTKAEAQSILQFLKENENIKPMKVAPGTILSPARRKGRG